MSADSPKRSSVRCVPAVVPPQVVTDRSLIDSVAGFINDVTLTSPPQGDPKDQVLWARFENMADVSDPTCGDDWELEGNVPPPLVIILGFGSGIKVYALPAHGEAVEVLGWRHGAVKALRILPTPLSSDDEMANEPIDQFVEQRPLMALCDSSSTTCSPQYCSVSFISLKNGAQVKMIKFKNPVVDILANRTSIVITFQERIAVFDARNLEDRLSITSCHPSPGINPNPIAIGPRWMAYSEWKLLPSKRSSGGCDCEGVSSYTATVLNAAKSLGKGLRELGEQVAAGLTGTGSNGSSASSSKSGSFESATGEIRQPGLVTIVDIKYPIKETSPTTGSPVTVTGTDPIIAHFIAHSDAIVALEFDPSGMLLLTADKRGHDFHIFRIQPHPAGSHLASVHQLYVLHRGDTSAKIQDIAFSLDSRWVAVSSLRGTTHVFPITPYGGPAGVRTHGSLHVVNRLSRFHRSAGLTVDGRSSSPISHTESACNQSCTPYSNPRTPPFPRPVVMHALAQIRQPSALGTPPGSAQNSYTRTGSGRQRLSSVSDDTGKEMRVCAVFAKARSWLLDPPNAARETPSHRMQKRAVDSLFLMAGHGALIQYDLDVKLASNIAKDKISDDTAIELEVEAKAQWYLGRRDNTPDIQPPLPRDNWLLRDPSYPSSDSETNSKDTDEQSDRWLSQVEIITHAGPHRRLWMGPQFVFKTYNTPSGAPLSHIDTEAVEIGISSMGNRPGRSSPMNMPLSASNKGGVPVLIESGSYSEFPSSFEQSPKLMDRFRHGHMESDFSFAHGDTRLKEDLADAMRESPSVPQKDSGLTSIIMSTSAQTTSAMTSSTSVPNAGTSTSNNVSLQQKSFSSTGASKSKTPQNSTLIEKVVNPLGTVTTITHSPSDHDLDSSNSNEFGDDYIIHENCDEALFRPVVAIFCDDSKPGEILVVDPAHVKPPEIVGTELIVPVIEEKKQKKQPSPPPPPAEKTKTRSKGEKVEQKSRKKSLEGTKELESSQVQIAKFNEMSLVNRKSSKTSKAGSKDKESSPPAIAASKKESSPQLTVSITSASKQTKQQQSEKSSKSNKTEECEKVHKTEHPLPKESEIMKDYTHKSKNDTLSNDFVKNLSDSQCKSKDDDEDIAISTIDKKPISMEQSKTAEVPAVKKEHSFDAASSFESIILASKKVIEKAEKVLVPGKKSEKVAVKLAKKEPVEDKTVKIVGNVTESIKNPPCVDVNESKNMDISVECVKINENPRQPELKAKNGNGKSKKTKDKPLVTLQEEDKQISQETDTTAGLKFYEKFTESDIKYVDIENFPPLQQVQLKDIEFPSLAASLSDTKVSGKKKGSNVSPKQSPQKARKEPIPEKREPTAEIDSPEAVCLTFSPKKKSRKNGPGEKITNDNMNICNNSNTEKNSSDRKMEASSEFSDLSLVSPSCSEKSTKSKDMSSQLSFELIPEYTEPALPPLPNISEPPIFDDLYYETQPDAVSLINFESPIVEDQGEIKLESVEAGGKDMTGKKKPDPSSPRHKYTKENLILALCGSLHEYNSTDYSKEAVKTDSTISNEGQGEISSEMEEQYLSLERSTYHEHTPWTSSSEDTEKSSRHVIKKHSRSRHHATADDDLVRRDDDEELRPLIGGTNSASSMTSSSGGNTVTVVTTSTGKRQASAEDDDENAAIALAIEKAISDSLPDNNSHSDSSDQGNAQQSSEDLDFDMPSTPSPPNDVVCITSAKKQTDHLASGFKTDLTTSVNAKKKWKRKKR